jgi:hypothetical protein
MSVTFYVAGAPASPLDERSLILSNTQAVQLLRWLGLPCKDLYGNMWAGDLIPVIRRCLHPAVVEVGDQGRPHLEITHPSGGRELFIGRSSGTMARWARQLMVIAEHAGNGNVAWS